VQFRARREYEVGVRNRESDGCAAERALKGTSPEVIEKRLRLIRRDVLGDGHVRCERVASLHGAREYRRGFESIEKRLEAPSRLDPQTHSWMRWEADGRSVAHRERGDACGDRNQLFPMVACEGNRQRDAQRSRWLKEDLTREARREGIRIFSIAFTGAADYSLIQTLAFKTGGAYFRAYRPEEIHNVFNRIHRMMIKSFVRPSLNGALKPSPIPLPEKKAAPARKKKEKFIQDNIEDRQQTLF